MANMFDENGNYNKTEWKPGDRITAGKLNKIEESLEAINNNDIERHKEADERLDILEYNEEVMEERVEELEDLVADNKSEVEVLIYENNVKMDRLEQEMNDGIDTVEAIAHTVDDKIADADANMKAQVAEVHEVAEEMEGLLDETKAFTTNAKTEIGTATTNAKTEIGTATENGLTELEDLIKVFDMEEVYKKVDGSLDDMEAMVAEVDGELSEIKSDKLKKVDYLTPKMFGAVGDGLADDTEALRNAIYQSHITGKMLYFPNDCKCLISAPLNYYNEEYYGPVLNMRGVLPTGKWEYALSKYGGICVKEDINIFHGKTISGEISNLSFIGIRSYGVHFFDNCLLNNIYIHGCNITNFGAFLYDTGLSGVSRIDRNTFLTNFYFHRAVDKYTSIVDSYITNNYINGGAEPTNNACFEFQNGNGSTIQGNFIDYYKTIYRPVGYSTVEFPMSIGNQYQVFLYLYEVDHGGSYKFTSVGDTFNWTNENKLDKLKTYEKSTYTGRDGQTYEKPTYIACLRHSSSVIFRNAYIQSSVGNAVFFQGHTGEYVLGEFELDFVGVDRYSPGQMARLEGSKTPYYINGEYTYHVCKPWFIEKVDALPGISMPWNSHPIGYMVRYDNENYKLIYKKDDSGTRVLQWVKFDDI